MKKIKALRMFLENFLVLGLPINVAEDELMLVIDDYFTKLGINWEDNAFGDEVEIALRLDIIPLIEYNVLLLNRIMIAKEFSKLVLEHTSTDELNAVLEEGVELDGGFDMITAFESVMECSWSEEFAELTNTAWDLAIKMKFYINE